GGKLLDTLTHLPELALGFFKFSGYRGMRCSHFGEFSVKISEIANIDLKPRAHLAVRRLQEADSASEILAALLKDSPIHRHRFRMARTLLAVRPDDFYLTSKSFLLFAELAAVL